MKVTVAADEWKRRWLMVTGQQVVAVALLHAQCNGRREE